MITQISSFLLRDLQIVFYLQYFAKKMILFRFHKLNLKMFHNNIHIKNTVAILGIKFFTFFNTPYSGQPNWVKQKSVFGSETSLYPPFSSVFEFGIWWGPSGSPRTYFTDVYGLVRSVAETGIAARDLRMMIPRLPTPLLEYYPVRNLNKEA